MATQLFLRNENADTHLATDNLKANGLAPTGWNPKGIATTRGGGLVTAAANTVAGTTNGVEVEAFNAPIEWISPPISADVTIAGTITLNIWVAENNMSANVAINAIIEVIRANATATRNSNTLVQIAKTARITEEAVTTRAAANFTVTPTSTVVNKGDRLRIRIIGDDAGTMGSGFTFNVSYGGATGAADGDTFVTFTETFAFASAPAGTVIYPTNTVSDVATASVDREAWTSRGAGVQNDVTNTVTGWTAPVQVTDTAGGTVVDWFTKQLQAFTLSGKAVGNIRWSGTWNSARCEIARVDSDGTNPVVWCSWCLETQGDEFNHGFSGVETAYTFNLSGDDLAISDGQRLRIRFYIDEEPASAMASGGTETLYYAGTSAAASGDSYITFTQTLTEFVADIIMPSYSVGPMVGY